MFVASRTRNSVASTSTRPGDSAAAWNPHSTERAKASFTVRVSAAPAPTARNCRLGATISTFGPTRSKTTMREPESAPRSMPMSLEPRPDAKPVLCSISVPKRDTSIQSCPDRSSQ